MNTQNSTRDERTIAAARSNMVAVAKMFIEHKHHGKSAIRAFINDVTRYVDEIDDDFVRFYIPTPRNYNLKHAMILARYISKRG